MLRYDSLRSADCNRVLMQGTAAAVNTPDGAGASLRAADDAALCDTAKSEAIKLDLYHLVWIFAVCSVLGLIGETVVSYFVDGRWENRAGFFVGAFQPDLRRWRCSDDVGARSLVGCARRRVVRCGGCCRGCVRVVCRMVLGERVRHCGLGLFFATVQSGWAYVFGHRACMGSCRRSVGEAGVAGDAARGRYGPQCMACAVGLGIAGVFPGGYGGDVRGVRLLDEPLGRGRARRCRAAPLRRALRQRCDGEPFSDDVDVPVLGGFPRVTMCP